MKPKDYIRLIVRRGEVLKRMRDDELRKNAHPRDAILALDGPFRHAIATIPPKPTSGFVEYQALLARLRSDETAI